MKEAELLKIHRALWADQPPHTIWYRGKRLAVETANDSKRDFKSVTVDGLIIITQNLKKGSTWTTWVKRGKGRKVTWVIKDGQYIGCAKTWLEDKKEHTEIRRLPGDEVLLKEVA